MTEGSGLQRLLGAGHFVVTAEVNPPTSASLEELREAATLLRGAADAYNVTDNIRAYVRMASWAGALLLLQEGLEPILQMVTRDRNRIALQSDLLGAAAHGVRNVLCLGGDDPGRGGEPRARAVEDLTPEALLAALQRLRDEGRLHGGEEVQKPPALFLGAVSNPFGGSYEVGAEILARRVEAGADFVQTQAVFDVEGLGTFLARVRDLALPRPVALLAGVIPLRSAKMARFLQEKVPGIRLPSDVMARMEAASDPPAEGIRICLETLERVQDLRGVAGVHLMPVGGEARLREIVDRAGLLPRPEVAEKA